MPRPLAPALAAFVVAGLSVGPADNPIGGRLAAASPRQQQPAPPGLVFESAAAFYARYRGIVAKARNVDEVVAFWSTDQVQQYENAPDSERPNLVQLKRIYAAHTNVRVVSETSQTPTNLSLRLEGMNVDNTLVTGNVLVVIERGVWKVAGPESWP
jgi:hypothetical protein